MNLAYWKGNLNFRKGEKVKQMEVGYFVATLKWEEWHCVYCNRTQF
jgi:hypothetical protein